MTGDLDREHPGIKSSMLKAIQNVHPRHLLDRRLTPLSDLARDLAPGADDAPTAQPLPLVRRPTTDAPVAG